MKKMLIVLICFGFLQVSCGMKKITTGIVGGIAKDGMVSLEGEEDVEIARDVSLPLIKTLEVFREGDPKNVQFLSVLSQSYGQYAFGFLEEDMLGFKPGSPQYERSKQLADLFYRRGREYGIAALSRDSAMFKAFKGTVPEFKKAVNKLGKKYVPALFWTSFNWANYLNMHLDDPNSIADLPRIQAMIDRVIAVDPNFYYGSARAFKGVIASSRPKMFGGDTDLANKEFEAAMSKNPDYLMTKVLYSQYYAKQMMDAGLFNKTLTDVLEADVLKLPAQRLANELAKRRAKILLSKEKQLF